MNVRSSESQNPVLGIDPGRRGAAVLLDRQRRIVMVAIWKPAQRRGRSGFRFRVLGNDESVWLPDVGYLSANLVAETRRAGVGSVDLFVEDSYVGRNARTSIAGARWSGMLVGAMQVSGRAGWLASVRFVLPDRWRSVAVGVAPATKRAEVKRLVIEWVRRCYPSLPLFSDESLSDHVADAVGISVFGVLDQQRGEDSHAAESD